MTLNEGPTKVFLGYFVHWSTWLGRKMLTSSRPSNRCLPFSQSLSHLSRLTNTSRLTTSRLILGTSPLPTSPHGFIRLVSISLSSSYRTHLSSFQASVPSKRSFGFVQKPSLSSLSFARSSTSAASYRSRGSDSQSYLAEPSEGYPGEVRKGKPLAFLTDIMRKRSRSKLSLDNNDSTAPYSFLPLNPSQMSMPDSAASHRSYSPTNSSSLPLRRERDKARIGKPRLNKLPQLPTRYRPDEVSSFTLDTDLSHMDGIVRSDALGVPSSTSPPSSAFESALSSFSPPSPSTSLFSDPFSPDSTSSKRRGQYFHDFRKISPKSISVPYNLNEQTQDRAMERAWIAPESWAVEKDEDDTVGGDTHTSSEEECFVASNSRSPDDGSTLNDTSTRKRFRRKPHRPRKPTSASASGKVVRVRIYRDNGSYHVAQILPTSTVADLTPSLNAKLLLDQERETHKLYIKERGRGMHLIY